MICYHCGKKIETKISPAATKQILSLSKKGYSCRYIAVAVGCSFASVARIIREARK